MSQHPQVVILGGGFAGLYTARSLRRAPVRITVIGQVSNYRLFTVRDDNPSPYAFLSYPYAPTRNTGLTIRVEAFDAFSEAFEAVGRAWLSARRRSCRRW